MVIASTRTIVKAQPITEALGIPLFAVPLDDQYSLDDRKINGLQTKMTVDIGSEVLGDRYQQSAQLISAFLSYQSYARLIILFDNKLASSL